MSLVPFSSLVLFTPNKSSSIKLEVAVAPEIAVGRKSSTAALHLIIG